MNTQQPLITAAKNIYSQTGEDGIIERIFSIIGTENKWCVEFGAWDGTHYSNTANLIRNQGWSAVLIEADARRYRDLVAAYKDNTKVLPLNRFVQFEGNATLDALLAQTAAPKNLDLLSIDIDGNDYHIWDSLKVYTPRVVVIEFNPTIPAEVDFVQPRNMRVTQGSSLLAITNLAKTKGYELVAATDLNGIYVRRDYFPRFGIADNSPAQFKNHKQETQLFQLYDGTVMIRGAHRLLWSEVNMSPRHLQVIPRMFRIFPDNMSSLRRFFFRIWRLWHNKLT